MAVWPFYLIVLAFVLQTGNVIIATRTIEDMRATHEKCLKIYGKALDQVVMDIKIENEASIKNLLLRDKK